MMVVAIARIGLDTSSSSSLKDKRSIAKAVIDRTRHRFNISISEIEELDSHSLLVLGITTVSNSAAHVQARVDKLLDFIEKLCLAPVVFREREITHFGNLAEPFWNEEDSDDLNWDDVKNTSSPLGLTDE